MYRIILEGLVTKYMVCYSQFSFNVIVLFLVTKFFFFVRRDRRDTIRYYLSRKLWLDCDIMVCVAIILGGRPSGNQQRSRSLNISASNWCFHCATSWFKSYIVNIVAISSFGNNYILCVIHFVQLFLGREVLYVAEIVNSSNIQINTGSMAKSFSGFLFIVITISFYFLHKRVSERLDIIIKRRVRLALRAPTIRLSGRVRRAFQFYLHLHGFYLSDFYIARSPNRIIMCTCCRQTFAPQTQVQRKMPTRDTG